MATTERHIVPNKKNVEGLLQELYDGEIIVGCAEMVSQIQAAIKAKTGLPLSRKAPRGVVEEVVINFAADLPFEQTQEVREAYSALSDLAKKVREADPDDVVLQRVDPSVAAQMGLAGEVFYEAVIPTGSSKEPKESRPSRGKRDKKTGGTKRSQANRAINAKRTAANKKATQERLAREEAKRNARRPEPEPKPEPEAEAMDPFAAFMEEGPSEEEVTLLRAEAAEAEAKAEAARKATEAKAKAEAARKATEAEAKAKAEAEARELQAFVKALSQGAQVDLAPTNPGTWKELPASDPRYKGTADQERRLADALARIGRIRTIAEAEAFADEMSEERPIPVIVEGDVEKAYPVYLLEAASRKRALVSAEAVEDSARNLGRLERKVRALEAKKEVEDDQVVFHALNLARGAEEGLETLKELGAKNRDDQDTLDQALTRRFLKEEAGHPCSTFSRRRAKLAAGQGGADTKSAIIQDMKAAAAEYVSAHAEGELSRLQEEGAAITRRIFAQAAAVHGGREITITPFKGQATKLRVPGGCEIFVTPEKEVKKGDPICSGLLETMGVVTWHNAPLLSAPIGGKVTLGSSEPGYRAQVEVARNGRLRRHKADLEGSKKTLESSREAHKALQARFESQGDQDKALQARLRVWFGLSATQRAESAQGAGVKAADLETAVAFLLPREETVAITVYGRVPTAELKKLGLERLEGGRRDTAQATMVVVSKSQEAAMRQALEAKGYRLKGGGRRAQGRKSNVGSFGAQFGDQLAQLRKQLS